MDPKQFRMLVNTVSFKIEKMIKDKEKRTFFPYSGEYMVDAVVILQHKFRGTALVSRTPEGIVAHPLIPAKLYA